ncbi:DUF5690 family protein [Chitinophaga lutea]|uniref:DUF5690 family protein n=1 Tax=Chitinophaga lutea TaxID=2488634 RepID=UPI001FE6649D|nr:DUF5690 family protein [Chitinophaga lutea]
MAAVRFTRREIWVAILAAITGFSAYTAIFAYRKAFNVAPFSGHTLLGADYKVVLVVTQILGYMASKFYGIRFIAALPRVRRHWLIFMLVGIAWMAWLLFALLPPPYNFWCLLLNGFPLGLIWGIVFSYVEGRRTTDLISAALAVSFIFASGLAKTTAQWVMNAWQVSEYWMPFTVGAIFAPALILFVLLLEKIPPPDAEDRLQRMERQPMSEEDRKALLRGFLPGIVMLTVIYILVTVLREVRDSFMADMWRASGETFMPGVFAKTETSISLIILVLIAVMIWLRDNFKAFMLAHWMMLAGFCMALLTTLLFRQHQLPMYNWMLLVGLGLYMVYIPFNSILFDRFIAAFRFSGNAGFLIYIADAYGYLGSIAVMVGAGLMAEKVNWLAFYMQLVMIAGVVGIVGTVAAMVYFRRKKLQQRD